MADNLRLLEHICEQKSGRLSIFDNLYSPRYFFTDIPTTCRFSVIRRAPIPPSYTAQLYRPAIPPSKTAQQYRPTILPSNTAQCVCVCVCVSVCACV